MIEDSELERVGGSLASVYRGGRDETTFGPYVWVTGLSFDQIGLRNAPLMRLHGVQNVRFTDNQISASPATEFTITTGKPTCVISGGAIINLSPLAGSDGGGPGASAYATSKGAVMTFSRAMTKELGPRNIRVNSLCPGMIATTFHNTVTKDEVRANVANSTPLKRQGHPDEIADAVAYLASGESAVITGANIDINGGLYFS